MAYQSHNGSNNSLPPIQSIFAFHCEHCDQRFPRAEERNQHRCPVRTQDHYVVPVYPTGFHPPPPSPALTSVSSSGSSYNTGSSRASSVSRELAGCDLGSTSTLMPPHKRTKRTSTKKTHPGRIGEVAGAKKPVKDPKKIKKERLSRSKQGGNIVDLEDIKTIFYDWGNKNMPNIKRQRPSNGGAASLAVDKNQNLIAASAGLLFYTQEAYKQKLAGQSDLFDRAKQVMTDSIAKDAPPPLTGSFLAQPDGTDVRCNAGPDLKNKACVLEEHLRDEVHEDAVECRKSRRQANFEYHTARELRRIIAQQASPSPARRSQYGKL